MKYARYSCQILMKIGVSRQVFPKLFKYRLTSRCRRTESIVSLERGGLFMCRIASLFLLQRLKGSMWGDARDFNNMETRAIIKFFFFPARQGAEGNSRHSDRNIREICTIVWHRQKMGGPLWTWLFFHLCCALSWTTQKSDNVGDYWSNWRANFGIPSDFG